MIPMESMTVSLEKCRFFAHHGVMDQERVSGNEFEVSISVIYPITGPNDDDLSSTISYAELYEIAKAEMAKPRNLLETVARDITCIICERWAYIEESRVEICKLTPPIPGITGSARVCVTRINKK
ncbi:MAG: dihydroneopterin aldolase [Muribaculaceae bacterium]|nr:dihydroneopterin aldolase [Muribaculaceae bacterium]